MSVPGTMGQDPNPKYPVVQPVNCIGPDVPPDPLLKSGSFIAANGKTSMETPKAKTARHKLSKTPERRGSSNGVRACPAAENSNGAEPVTPMNGSENTESQAGSGRRKGSEQDFNWLPSGWIVEDKVRNSGVTAGSVDKYYFDPVSGCRFRSKKEVLFFLETGTRRKRKPTENSDAETKGSGGHKSGGHKQKSSAAAKSSVLNFDFSNVPEKVNWVLSDSPEESWTPYIGDDMVAESSKQEWAAAFKFLTSRISGRNY